MTTLGITGGIGSGKSYVSQLLSQQYGIPVYDCDREAKRLNEESVEIRQGLLECVGSEVYDEHGRLQKAILAHYLFQSEENQQRINAIIHPVVREDFRKWCNKQQGGLVGMESAILLESGFDDLTDCILLVTAPLELRIQRAMQRDQATRQQIESRIRLQLTDEERATRCHYTLLNDGRQLAPQLEDVMKKVRRQ